MNIAFDIDGVLTDFEWFLNVYGTRYFSKKFHMDAKVVNPETSKIAERFGYGQKEETAFYTRYLLWYARKMPIRENAATTINMLREEGHKVYFITARALANHDNLVGQLMRSILKNWLRENRVEYDGIHFVSMSDSAEEKRKLCEQLQVDVMVEDDPKNIREISKVCRVVCMLADYNKSLLDVNHALDFGEVYRYIHESQYADFNVLTYQERALLSQEETVSYFQKLSQYYKKLPFDKDYLRQRENHLRKMVPIPRFFVNSIFGIRIVQGSIPQGTSGAIFVCNHRRSLDVYMCYCILNKTMARILTKREYEERMIGRLMKYAGIIFIKREDKKSGKMVQNLMIQTVMHGGNIVLFPEGTRNRTEEVLLPFKYGAVYMAQVTGAPIIPITIDRISKREHVVRIGEEMRVDYKDDLTMCKQRLQEQMRNMLI